MEIFSMVLSLLSGVALFLFGMSLMGRWAETRLPVINWKTFLYKIDKTHRLKGVEHLEQE